MIRLGRCPSQAELERAFWCADPKIRSHQETCSSCRSTWAEIAALVEESGGLPEPAPSMPAQRERIRASLLAGVDGPRVDRPWWRRRWRLTAPLAVAAVACGLIWWAWPHGAVGPTRADRRGKLLGHPGARYLVVAAQPDEIIRLIEGTISVEVDELRPGERFRVITGDSEIEVKGTAFDVTSSGDRLVAVRVMHGTVEVRGGTARKQVLEAGHTWKAATDENSAGANEQKHPAEATPVAARHGHASRPPGEAPPAPPASVEGGARQRNRAQQAFDVGWNGIRTNRFADAAQAFQRVVEAGADAPVAEDARFWRAVALARAGEQELAVKAFEDFLESHPGSVRMGEAGAMLGWLLFRRGDRALAERHFRAAAGDPTPRVRDSAAAGLRALQAGR